MLHTSTRILHIPGSMHGCSPGTEVLRLALSTSARLSRQLLSAGLPQTRHSKAPSLSCGIEVLGCASHKCIRFSVCNAEPAVPEQQARHSGACISIAAWQARSQLKGPMIGRHTYHCRSTEDVVHIPPALNPCCRLP